VVPALHGVDHGRGDLCVAQQEIEDPAAQGVLEQQRVDGGDGHEGVVGPHQPLGCEDVDVGMEGEVLAERLQGENQARRVLGLAGRHTHHVGDGTGGGAREIGEQAAVVAEVEPQALGDAEDHLAMRDWEEDLFDEVGGGECGAAGGTGGAEPAAAAGESEQAFGSAGVAVQDPPVPGCREGFVQPAFACMRAPCDDSFRSSSRSHDARKRLLFTSASALQKALRVGYRPHYLGEAQVVAADGTVLARRAREEGEGIAVARLTLAPAAPAETLPDRFWIPELPLVARAVWRYQNAHGTRAYQRVKAARGFAWQEPGWERAHAALTGRPTVASGAGGDAAASAGEGAGAGVA